MKILLTTLTFLFLFSSYTSRIELQYDQDNKELIVTMQGLEHIEEVSIYSGKELLTSFKPLSETIRVKRECPLPNRIRYVVKLKTGLVIDDRHNRKTDLKHASSYIEICEPKD